MFSECVQKCRILEKHEKHCLRRFSARIHHFGNIWKQWFHSCKTVFHRLMPNRLCDRVFALFHVFFIFLEKHKNMYFWWCRSWNTVFRVFSKTPSFCCFSQQLGNAPVLSKTRIFTCFKTGEKQWFIGYAPCSVSCFYPLFICGPHSNTHLFNTWKMLFMPFLSLGRKKHHLGLLLFTRENSQNRCVFGPRIQGRILQFWCFQNQPKHTKNGVFGTPKKHALS